MHNWLIGTAGALLKSDAPASGRTDDSRPTTTKGGPEGPPLVRSMLRCGSDYQLELVQPFVPPVQLRVYVPGEVLDFVIRNTPVEFEVDESV